MTRIGIALLAVAAISGCARERRDLVVSGRVEVDSVRVGSEIGGRVAEVRFEESEPVKAGEVVVLLDDRELSSSVGQAEAAVAQAKANLDLLLAGSRKEDVARAEGMVNARQAELEMRRKGFRAEEVSEAAAQAASARSNLDLAKRELERVETLYKSRTIEQREFDRARMTHDTAVAAFQAATQREALYKSGSRPEEIAMAEGQLAQAQADLDRLRNGARPEEIAAQRAAVQATEANAQRLRTQFEETRIIAPSDCVVETLDLHPGDLVRAGETVAVLDLRNTPWVRCYVPENRLGFVRPGEEVTVSVDSFPGKAFRAKVAPRVVRGGVHAPQCADHREARRAGFRDEGRPAGE